MLAKCIAIKTKELMQNEKKSTFIIWTPLHLFNALRFILSRGLIGRCDAFYICQSDGMEKYYQGVLSEGIFKNIYSSSHEKLKKNQRFWEVTAGLFYPPAYVWHMFGREATDNRYDMLFMSVPTRLNDAIIRANDCREIVGYDDGTGSYLGNLYDCSLGRKYELIKKTISNSSYQVTKAYINNPEIADQGGDIEYEKLLARDLTDGEREQVKRVFGYKDNVYLTPFIYLNQPIKEITSNHESIQTEEKIIEILTKELGSELSVRMHPREKDKELYRGLKLNDNTQMWEIICSEENIDEKVLISSFSTAQFTPKLLFNKEPYIIFTIKMLEEYCEKKTISNAERLINLLKDKYTRKSRVISVNNKKELEETLRNISNIQ